MIRINNLTVNPATDQAAAQRVLSAAKQIYQTGMYWDHILEPRLTVEADQETAYPVTVDGDEYLQQIFTVTSETWVDGYRTGELGEILLTDLQPGTYLVQEVAADDKHVLDGTPQQVELHAGEIGRAHV